MCGRVGVQSRRAGEVAGAGAWLARRTVPELDSSVVNPVKYSKVHMACRDKR